MATQQLTDLEMISGQRSNDDAHSPGTPAGQYILRLYVAGSTPQSSRAISNLKRICETHLKGRYDLTVVDLYLHKELAQADQIVVAPMLVREAPLPARRAIGDLSDTARVLAALDLPPAPLPP